MSHIYLLQTEDKATMNLMKLSLSVAAGTPSSTTALGVFEKVNRIYTAQRKTEAACIKSTTADGGKTNLQPRLSRV
jgi:hypothetical protein